MQHCAIWPGKWLRSPDVAVVAVRESLPPVQAVQWAETVSQPGELPMPAIDTNNDARHPESLALSASLCQLS